MTKNEFITTMTTIQKKNDYINSFFEDMSKYLCSETWSDELDDLVCFTLDLVGKLVNDEEEWISWFCWDNDWGKNKKECTVDGKVYYINSLGGLYDVIKEADEKFKKEILDGQVN